MVPSGLDEENLLADCAGLPEAAGFRTGASGTLTSRTIMLHELQLVLEYVDGDVTRQSCFCAVIEDNLLGKKTLSNRKLTAQRLAEFYGFEPSIPVFSGLLSCWGHKQASPALLACLCACARDPLLRASSLAVLPEKAGSAVKSAEISAVVAKATSGRLSASTCDKVARNAASSWTQTGHLIGRLKKTRQLVAAGPTETAYALYLGWLAGLRGRSLLSSYWTKVLDLSETAADRLAYASSKLGLLRYIRHGDLVQIEPGETFLQREP